MQTNSPFRPVPEYCKVQRWHTKYSQCLISSSQNVRIFIQQCGNTYTYYAVQSLKLEGHYWTVGSQIGEKFGILMIHEIDTSNTNELLLEYWCCPSQNVGGSISPSLMLHFQNPL